MPAFRLDESALDRIASALREAGGLAALIPRSALRDPVALVPEDVDPDLLDDLDTGGIANQAEADAELSLFLHFLKKRNGRLHGLLFDDPWATPGDMDYAGPPPTEIVTIGGHVMRVHDLAEFVQDLLWQYRANAVSFLKIIFVSELTFEHIRELAEDEPDDLLDRLARSIRHVAVNAYNDETWAIADVLHVRPE